MLSFQVGFVFVCLFGWLVGWLVVVVGLFVYLSVFPACA